MLFLISSLPQFAIYFQLFLIIYSFLDWRVYNWEIMCNKTSYVNLVAHVYLHNGVLLIVFLTYAEYRKSSIRSRLSIILDLNFPRIVLEVVQKHFRANIFIEVLKDPLRTLKRPKNIIFLTLEGVSLLYRPTSN